MRICALLPLPTAENPVAVLTPLAGEAALIHIVRALAAAAAEVTVFTDAALAGQLGPTAAGLPVQIVIVGETASRSACLEAAARHATNIGATHVLLADHRHPLLPAALVARVVDMLATGAEWVVPVLPVPDTVKVVDGQGTITATVDRSELQVSQYPQGMSVARLGAATQGGAVSTVVGDPEAVAAELPADAALLEAIIACRR